MRNESSRPSAAILIIGNEILSGSVEDRNISHIAGELVEIGVDLEEVRVVPDIEIRIVNAVNELRNSYDYVFTTGGIGPTHDDITSQSIAKAFNTKLEEHVEVIACMQEYYYKKNVEFNKSRRKMARIPIGAKLIPNSISSAPGYSMENVYVMAGIPQIMRIMFDNIKPHLKGGKKIHSITINAKVSEGEIAEELENIQNSFPNVDIGSYPDYGDAGTFVNLVIRSDNIEMLKEVETEIKFMLPA